MDTLKWHEESRRRLLETRVFSIFETTSRGPDGRTGHFSLITARDWAIVIPVLTDEAGDQFLMVRQWRHGAARLSLEFPGGVLEPGELPEEGAARELEEETGYRAGTLRALGTFNPNPAIQSNTVHIFLAKELEKKGGQHLDHDEFVDVIRMPAAQVLAGMGQEPFIHALMASALALYLRDEMGS